MKNMNYFYIIILCFYSINSSKELIGIIFNNETFSLDDLEENTYIKMIPDSNSNLPDYLQIFVKGHNEFKADVDHIITKMTHLKPEINIHRVCLETHQCG